MKLLTRYNRSTIAITTAIMLVAAVAYYFAITAVLSRQVDKALEVEEHEVRDYALLNGTLPHVFSTNHQAILFTSVNTPQQRKFVDTVYRDLKDEELESARALYTWVKVQGKQYRVVVVQSKVETEDLIKVIFLITLGLIVALLAALFFLNRIILSNIWKPFYKILEQLKAFNLAENSSVKTVPSGIDEFRELDSAVNLMADRVKDDYQALKAFTENASHELMTPISVINSKLDTFVQTGEFTDTQSRLLNDMYASVTRLTRLNKSMLLLAKIENRLIADKQDLNLKILVEEALNQFEEPIIAREITIESHLDDKPMKASLLLMEVLISNLISNALRHNKPGGFISTELNHLKLQVSNSSNADKLNTENLFRRFQKSASSEGSGLGLTISKQICDMYGFNLAYMHLNGVHHFIITFAPTA
ncbi:sensor histidine kinase [Mucilaginibacter terrae]|uniref:histidine kinase n=1 Tax=Mucilaginibacter terrae TaxID=1955052 RepID=A0ABU3GQS7_9SPHI|nr:HAMP domain-containing sensor histidine kinase [Mucilaginibacter terrae]MDT3401000.1 signal transduction histidine kinase [Mucilaginibacter terrae]